MTWKETKAELQSLSKHEIDEIEIIGKLVDQRIRLKISQRELAELTKLSQSSIARIESLMVSPRLDTLVKIADALNMEIQLTEQG